MSGVRDTALHIEWSPSSVTAKDLLTGRKTVAANLAELSAAIGRPKEALIGVSRHVVFMKTVRLPKAAQDDLRQIVGVQIGTMFPLPADQLTFDCFQTEDINVDGCLTLIAAIRTEDLKGLRAELQQMGCKPTRILPVALGAPAAALAKGVSDALLLEKTPAGLALDVVQGGVLRFTRTTPLESDPLCEAQRTLMAARAGSLPFFALGDIDFSEAQSSAGSALDFLHQAHDFHFEMEEERRLAEKRRIGTRTRQAALLLLGAMSLVAFIAIDRSDANDKVRKGEAAWARQLKKLRDTRDGLVKKAQSQSAMANTLKSAFEPAQPMSDVLALTSDCLPANAWLTGLTLERGKPVQIRGSAKTSADVTFFTTALGDSKRYRDVKLVFANTAKIDTQPIIQFSITAYALGNLPMPAPVKAAGKAKKRTPSKAEASLEKAQ